MYSAPTNFYLEKSDLMAKLIRPLLGNALFIAKSDAIWKLKRKSMSQAFYKERLKQLAEVIKDTAMEEMAVWKKKGEIELIRRVGDLHSKIIVDCLLGRGAHEYKVK